MIKWIESVEEVCRDATQEVLLVAPFIKRPVVKRLLGLVPADVAITVVTRWRLDEILMGVSDIEVWLELNERPGATLKLHAALHAKLYLNESYGYVGSANLTATALGIAPRSNLEVLVRTAPGVEPIRTLLEVLESSALAVDDAAYQEWSAAVSLAERPLSAAGEHDSDVAWFPVCRDPVGALRDLDYLGSEALIRSGLDQDLRALGVPSGGTRPALESALRAAVPATCLVQDIASWMGEFPQRFGQVSRWLEENWRVESGDYAAQVLYRWLAAFDPRFVISKPRHSELLTFVPRSPSR